MDFTNSVRRAEEIEFFFFSKGRQGHREGEGWRERDTEG